MKNILFVCTGNTCRSPMAQALFLQRLKEEDVIDRFRVLSAGIFTQNGLPASREAVRVLQEDGLDISEHTSAVLVSEIVMDADVILTMTRNHRDYISEEFPEKKNMVFTLGEFVNDEEIEVIDPFAKGIESYRQSREQLKQLINKAVNKLLSNNI